MWARDIYWINKAEKQAELIPHSLSLAIAQLNCQLSSEPHRQTTGEGRAIKDVFTTVDLSQSTLFYQIKIMTIFYSVHDLIDCEKL